MKELLVISLGILIAWLSSYMPMAEQEFLTVGSSGMVYGMLGMFIGMIMYGSLRIVNRTKFIRFTALLTVALLSGFIGARSNVYVHIWAMITGMAIQYLIESVKTFYNNRNEKNIQIYNGQTIYVSRKDRRKISLGRTKRRQ
jgi:membrane associated rhomboid family serine protease